jgi:nucleoside 2-deoxyribosyltransferase
VGLRIYLAGPEVFLADAREIGEAKTAICRAHGLVGVFPADPEIRDQERLPAAEIARLIAESNVALMDGCAGIIANLTPFRGVSMDTGTAFEMGHMASRGRLVLGYTNVAAVYRDRVVRYYQRDDAAVAERYSTASAIEDFGFAENLMIELAVRRCGGRIVVRSVAEGAELRDLAGFEACVAQARELLAGDDR